MISFNPSVATPLLLLMGVVATVGVHQAFLWFGRRREALHPWVVAWCANALLVLLSHYLQTVADSPECQLAGTDAACFWVVSADSRTLRLVAFSDRTLEADWPVPSLPFDVGVLGWVARYGRIVNVPDVFSDGRFVALDWWRSHGLRSFLGLPVMLDGVLLGVLALNSREPFRPDAEDERLLDAFVDQAARRAAEQALAEVKVLRGLLPICSYCKKVRGDENYWEQIESYVSEHSDAQFSHSICPECQDGVRKELDRWRTRA